MSSAERHRVTPRPQLDVTSTRVDGRLVVSLAGELDLATADDFRAAMRRHLPDGPVLLDLRELRFMGSAGIQALDELLREADAEGWSFAVHADIQRPVRRILELTGMLALLELEAGPIATEDR